MAVDVYHEGERTAQRRAGLHRQGESASRIVRSAIPAVARDFLAGQMLIVLGAADAQGRMWASPISGRPGFLRAESDTVLAVSGLPAPGDPLRARLGTPAPVGTIAVDFATRRRMRLNGRSVPDGEGVRVTLDQVYANCPKHIQQRHPRWRPATPAPGATSAQLPARLQSLIAGADTFFIATADRDGRADASHRGGNPGFVQVLSPTRLRWPDYTGNAMFNTLGNLEADARAGLLFLDWGTGTTVQLTGTARTDWDSAAAAALPGAQRVVDFTVTAVVEIAHASPLRWSAPQLSRFNPPVAPPP
ncbi:pyridoxamine 5'-phosphate oxidase family protein [Streptomyces thermodiastaticus]|jgi:predicted pyridoxine 5'-phosphate oxidase superfamily flavin-nucleotide-binding protein|uniref:pyridoxamine 5'-phosphate oxidase family protein n=1 Tax=Streptomyces thermodiastaticus TaxID=44061 RepID=UPI001672C712|nr:pyridoxamine 5'-phosphate oxidase family protein [Streptomyces thermodiastaticus]MCE7551904.1 pyridoxamine 5'-phosphate oxidase family protein [Streptomyces thermodiastaticus]